MQAQRQFIEALMKPQAYKDPPGQIEILQTHISFLVLTEKYAYKIKKPVNFGFLDFSTLEKRRIFCEKELELNRRLCGDMYIEVDTINCKEKVIKINGPGDPVEYALKMKRMPQDKIMSKLLEENRVDTKLVEQIARIIAKFHLKAETNERISKIGSFRTVKSNWNENFEQTRNMVGKTISPWAFQLIAERIGIFLKEKKKLFEKRNTEGKIRDCHGDIHSGNIFITDRVYIFDAIEFNERFRYSDVAADTAFLAMDLDFKGRRDLSDIFIKKYIAYSKDREVMELLPFYKCYRAYVRGKVMGFKLADPNVCDEERIEAAEVAKSYMKLAASYAEKL